MAHKISIPKGKSIWALVAMGSRRLYITMALFHCTISNLLPMATSTTMIDGMFALYSTPFDIHLLTPTLMQLFYTICMHGLLDPHIST